MAKRKKKIRLFPAYSDKLIIFCALILLIYGSLMVVSADMRNSVGDNGALVLSIVKQGIVALLGIAALSFACRYNPFRPKTFMILNILVTALLLTTLLFEASSGASAWIDLKVITIQPSEIAKVYIITYIAHMLSYDKGKDDNRKRFYLCCFWTLVYTFIIVVLQHDLGSGFILFGIAFSMLMANRLRYLAWHRLVFFLLFIGVMAAALYLLSPAGTAFLESIAGDNYQINRFLSSANPFKDPYGTGYHLIMSLVSFATGGWFGLGYGKSIHKYMNFPNPSSDFILAIFIEEMGIVFGLIPLVILYFLIWWRLISFSLNTTSDRARLVCLGTVMYTVLHFVLNVGGVTGLIPLTGVPLLLISAGGTSTVCCMLAIGLCELEIIRCRKHKEFYGQDN